MNADEPPKLGRPAATLKKDRWHVCISADVGLFFRMRSIDTLSGNTRKGAMSELVDALLRQEMERVLKLQGNA